MERHKSSTDVALENSEREGEGPRFSYSTSTGEEDLMPFRMCFFFLHVGIQVFMVLNGNTYFFLARCVTGI